MRYLILSISQIHCDCDSFIQFLRGHDFRNPRGAHVLIIDVTEGVSVGVQS